MPKYFCLLFLNIDLLIESNCKRAGLLHFFHYNTIDSCHLFSGLLLLSFFLMIKNKEYFEELHSN